jgi:dTDP-4-amino-4,6-dideoxygalactose transaminase
MIPLMKRRLPVSSQLTSYLSKSESMGQYTNFGPLHNELRKYFAERYKGESANVALASSATLALSLCISHYRQYHTLSSTFNVVMPSWTFSATAQSAMLLGCNITFIDTAPDGSINPTNIMNLIDNGSLEKPSLILPVIPFGRSYNTEEWEDFSQKTGIPVVIDCAAGFSSAQLSSIPTVVSTHATKYFPTGEGGFVLCSDKDFIAGIKAASNFGFNGSRSSIAIGTNAKLSEYHSAIGLAYRDTMLDHADSTYRRQAQQYFDSLKTSTFRPFANSIDNPVSTFNIQIPDRGSDSILESMVGMMVSRHAVEIRPWWQFPLHLQPAFAQCKCIGDMKNTRTLARTVVGIPLGEHLDTSLIPYIIESLENTYAIATEKHH